MKSEERHNLQKNELSKIAGKATAFYDGHQNTILWGFVVVLLGLAAWIYLTRSAQVSAASAWTSVQTAGSPADYLDVATQFPKSRAGVVSKLQAALAWLNMGVKDAFNNREQANIYLKDAKSAFDELVGQANLEKSVREQALYGLAQTLESISSGDTEAAVKAYQQLLAEFPETIFKEKAESRIKDLKRPETQDFLAWYQKQNPKPPEPEKPKDGQAPGAKVGAPKPDGEVGGLGLPAPPPVGGESPATGSPEPANAESAPAEKPAGEIKEPEKSAVPEESKGPALPTDAPPEEPKK